MALISMSTQAIKKALRKIPRFDLTGTFVGDAPAMPVHRYYNGAALQQDFGTIRDYQAPKLFIRVRRCHALFPAFRPFQRMC